MIVRILFLCLLCLPLVAQDGGTTFQEQNARLQNINAFLLDFRPNAPPRRPEKSELSFILDVNPQPSINFRVGRKEEPIDPPSVVPKLRARYEHRSGLMVGAAFAPGIEFEDYEAEYISVEAGYRMNFGKWVAGLRASYSDGDVTGAITNVEIDDDFTFENLGADLSLGRTWNAFQLYGFVGYNDIETTLLINEDGAFLRNAEDTYYGGLGVGYAWKKLHFNLEQNFTDDYLAHVTLSVAYRF
jgi:hypothetical protein